MSDLNDRHDITKHPIFNGQTIDVPTEKKSHTVVCVTNPQKYNYLHLDETGQHRTVIIRPVEGDKQHRVFIPQERDTYSKREFNQGKSQEFWTIRPKNNSPFTLNLEYSKGTIPLTLPEVFFQGNEPMHIITSHWKLREAQEQQMKKPFVMPAVDMLKYDIEEPLVMTEISADTMKKAGLRIGENDFQNNKDIHSSELEGFIKSFLSNTGGTIGQFIDNKALLKEFFPSGRFYIKEIKGRYYVIFKGYAGHRKEFAGVKYALNNPKMISLSIVKRPLSGSIDMLKESFESPKGTIIGLIIIGAVDLSFWIKDGILSDNGFYISELLIDIGSDFVKGIIATVAACFAVAGLALLATLAGAATLPVVVVIGATLAVSFVVGMGLDAFDKKFGITECIQDAAKEIEKEARSNFTENVVSPIKDAVQSLNEAVNAYFLKAYISQFGMR